MPKIGEVFLSPNHWFIVRMSLLLVGTRPQNALAVNGSGSVSASFFLLRLAKKEEEEKRVERDRGRVIEACQ